MSKMPWATYLWPGLPQLWHFGLWSGLVLAAGFAVLLNLLLLASFVWVELLSPLHLRLGWSVIGVLWAASTVISWRSSGRKAALRRPTSGEVLFCDALSEYLQGSWFEAETILGRLLHQDPRDVEARLLLATLLRHTRRYEEALDQLARLERLRDAEKWKREVLAERRWIAQGQADQTAASQTSEPPVPEVSRQAA